MNTPENIQELKENEIFVFGSNMNGNHAGGAARLAVEKFGAIMGQAEGIQGQSYAIPTLDKDMNRITMEKLHANLLKFKKYAIDNPDKTFYLTKIGCGIAGYCINDIAYLVIFSNFPENVILPVEFTTLHGVKGFSRNLTCRGYKYKIGEEYKETGPIVACSNGFHFCINPLSVFNFYTPSTSRYCSVLGSGDINASKSETKVAVSNLRILKELSILDIIEEEINYIFGGIIKYAVKDDDFGCHENNLFVKLHSKHHDTFGVTTGDNSIINVEGGNAAAISKGFCSAVVCNGYQTSSLSTAPLSISKTDGQKSIAVATSFESIACSDGIGSMAIAKGNISVAQSKGDYSVAVTTGAESLAVCEPSVCCVALSTGNGAASAVGGEDSIAISTGIFGLAKGALGCWIVLVEHDTQKTEGTEESIYIIKEVKAFKVDGEKIKADTFYYLRNGEPVEMCL